MSWVTIVWSMATAASLTLAAIHLVTWSRRPAAWASLLFAGVAISVAGMAVFEFLMMRARTPAEFGALGRWMHVPAFTTCLAIVGFIRVYLRAGRPWFLWSVVVLRALVLAINFLIPVNVNYREIHALAHPTFLGESISVPEGVANPWSRFDELTAFWLIAFVVDASITLWRRGGAEERRRAAVIGGSMALFVLVALTHIILVRFEVIRSPQLAGCSFMFLVAAMAFELGRDLLRAAQLAGELRESEQRMKLAGQAAGLGMWSWDVVRDEVWITDEGRALFGWTKSERVNFENFMAKVHPEDREAARQAVRRSLSPPGVYDTEYRLPLAGGATRWISGRGQVEFNDKGQAVRLRGVSIDITDRKQAEQEMQRHRQDLAHVSRVSIMGELSASMAHELNQPLTAILTNAQAGQRFLAAAKPDLEEFREILKDIAQDTTRARDVIRHLRALVKKSEPVFTEVDLGDAIREVVGFLHGDIVARNVRVGLDLSPHLPAIHGDRIQLQQVMINLFLNAFDAMNGDPVPERLVTVSSELESPQLVRVTVRDRGPGIAAGQLEAIFDPFYTTKREGMGMGLSVTRSIVESHGGRIWAENHPRGGAMFHFTVQISGEGQGARGK